MIVKAIELTLAVVAFCIGLTITAWIVTKFGNFVAVKLKIRDKE